MTFRKLAQLANVSVSVVSKAFSGREHLFEPVRYYVTHGKVDTVIRALSDALASKAPNLPRHVEIPSRFLPGNSVRNLKKP